MKKTKGFTLIELLVVIAIIGILSSVVLASLNTARSKGSDAAIKSQLADIRPQAEIDYDSWGGNYGTSSTAVTSCTQAGSLFAGDITVTNMIKGVQGNSAAVVCNENPASTQTSWAVSAQLKSNTSQYWCVDNTGASKLEAAQLGSGVSQCS
ncbi:MAG: type II secretion system protein [Patescibacteria group bacterium]|nr:type II secretion system protein [Patescibacteria group bacterium]